MAGFGDLFARQWRRKIAVSIILCVFTLPCFTNSSDRVCEPIRIELCRELGYNLTGMPNLIGHDLQQDAQIQLQTFTPLIQYGCSSRLRFFLCSVYVPMCTEKVPFPIGPCRSLCEDVRDRCHPVLNEFGFEWPPGLNCSKFPPQNNNKHMCMEGPADTKDHETSTRVKPRRPSVTKRYEVKEVKRVPAVMDKDYDRSYGLCRTFRSTERYYYINRTKRCAAHCHADINFSSGNKKFADVWVSVWSALCFISTAFTLLTFLVDDNRLQYPEGAIVFISICYNVCSLAYFIRLFAGRYETSCHIDPQHEVPILIQEGLENVNCTIIFVMLYFFGMAGAVWWVVLTFMWYLTAGLNWSAKVLDRYSTYFHLIAWSLPSALTITILVMRIVDADELLGSCFVGNQNLDNLLYFAIVPSVVYLFFGSLFLIMGFFKVYQKRRQSTNLEICSPLHKPPRLNALIIRIGIFAILYIVPALCVLASHVYEYEWRDEWLAAGSVTRPNVEVFTLKFFMSLVMGFTTGLWVWSSKTPVVTWQKLGRRMTRRKEPLPAYLNIKPQHNFPQNRTKTALSKASTETVV